MVCLSIHILVIPLPPPLALLSSRPCRLSVSVCLLGSGLPVRPVSVTGRSSQLPCSKPPRKFNRVIVVLQCLEALLKQA